MAGQACPAVASGSPTSHVDSWSSFPRERADLFRFIKDEGITGILLISGDRHFTGGYQIDGELIEVTAGPLGAQGFPAKNLPGMFFNQSEGKLYCVFDIDTRKSPSKSTAPATVSSKRFRSPGPRF